ncbi:myristoyl transferase [Halomonas urumqiensis]|uniref:Myristoyl transferase n=2 Tax=Halomonas urumqiensis TaxID=1684789 RepID=A0A2N7UQ12_9GAMM|nr:myristoyl transferase [Halomonas urumqiensis]PTB04007.1 ABC transporter substrate-binding protein [Halomonas urumqiensis]
MSATLAFSASVKAQENEPLQEVSIALGSQVLNVTYPWLMMPVALGYWRDEGYDVNVVGVQGSLQGLQMMASGGVDLVQFNSSVLIQANVENGISARGVMGNGVIDWGLGVKEDGPIQSIDDLKGKRIGIVSLATGGVPMLRALLRQNGIDPDRDVNIVAVGAGTQALQALRSGQVQGLMFWQSALTSFENAGTELRILRDPEWREMPDFTLGTLQSTIDEDPEMIEAIVRGANKATLFAMTNPECVRRIHWEHFPSTKPTGADTETLEQWDLNLLNAQLDTMRSAYELHGGELLGYVDPDAFVGIQEFLYDSEMIGDTIDTDELVIHREGFFEATNDFDHEEIIESAKNCDVMGSSQS